MPKVNPAILRWARETAGLSEAEAASKLRLRGTKNRTSILRLEALEEGIENPTRPMLVKMAKQYRRPLLTFYLSVPPRRGNRGQDYRTLPQDHLPVNEALLDALIRDVQARQSLVRSAILDEDETHKVEFVGSKSTTESVASVLRSIRAALDLPLELFRESANPEAAFQVLRQHVEDIGVFVLLLGNLGSYHTDIDLDTFRGFVIADDVAPFIVINDHDHRGAWSFTLLHELTHLWMGQTGVSGGAPERKVEKFCNDVASEFLLPTPELSRLRDVEFLGHVEAASAIDQFASDLNVSRSMVVYRLYRNHVINHARWHSLSSHFRDLWIQERETRRTKSKSSAGGPNYYVVRRHRLGAALIDTTARFMASGVLTTTKAGRVLGVKPRNVQNLLTRDVSKAI